MLFLIHNLFRNKISIPCVLFLSVLGVSTAQAAAFSQLPVVKPIISCEDLKKTDLKAVADTPAAVESAALIDTPKGQFCKVLGNIQPSIGFEVDLPVTTWQQRFLMGGCGGLCGMRSIGITNAGKCAPALEGGFVVAGDDMGHTQKPGESQAAFAADPQKRIDFAYRGNHATTLIAKALIKAYYGQAPKYSYFMGCSDGGREALMEAQRYPDDFDGISAGAPAAGFQVQNSFYHAWMANANKRADGTNILLRSRMAILHDAVLKKCDTLSGVSDGLLQDPRACTFDPALVQCPADATDNSKCLTAEEVATARKLYQGPTDAEGNRFITGGPQLGAELQWGLPGKANGSSMSAGMAASSMEYVILPAVSPADGDISRFAFTKENFARISQLHSLYDATNTNLRSFQRRGGKLLLWHGWSDTSITPMISIAYYEGLQKEMGVAQTDRFARLFLLPGVGHCGGGDGYTQVDLLSPLMTWVEAGSAPAMLLAEKVEQNGMMMGPPDEDGPRGMPAGGPGPTATSVGGPGAAPVGPPPSPAGGPRFPRGPIAQADKVAQASRPVFPYPMIPRYTGKGDPNQAANYVSVANPVPVSQKVNWYGNYLIAPNFQKIYGAENGKLVIKN